MTVRIAIRTWWHTLKSLAELAGRGAGTPPLLGREDRP